MVRFLALISVLLMLKFFSLVNWIKDLAVKIASKIEFEGRIPSFTWDSNKQWKTATSSPEASHHQTLESFVYFNYKQESFPSCHFQLLLWVSNVFTSWFHWLRFAVEGWSLFFLYKTLLFCRVLKGGRDKIKWEPTYVEETWLAVWFPCSVGVWPFKTRCQPPRTV